MTRPEFAYPAARLPAAYASDAAGRDSLGSLRLSEPPRIAQSPSSAAVAPAADGSEFELDSRDSLPRAVPPASAQLATATSAKDTHAFGMDHADSVHYDISVRQEPIRARMCGFSNARDRRLLSPPLVLQVATVDDGTRRQVDCARSAALFCHVSLWSADGREHHSAVLNPRATMSRSEEMEIRSCLGPLANHRTLEAASADATISATARKATADQYCDLLVGTHLARSRVLFDLDDSQGMFFIFGDLGVRSPGKYILKCSVLSFNIMTQSFDIVGKAQTSVFEVCSPKNFPGAIEPTILCRAFARQGVLMYVRTEGAKSAAAARKRRARAAQDNDDADDAYSPEYPAPTRLRSSRRSTSTR